MKKGIICARYVHLKNTQLFHFTVLDAILNFVRIFIWSMIWHHHQQFVWGKQHAGHLVYLCINCTKPICSQSRIGRYSEHTLWLVMSKTPVDLKEILLLCLQLADKRPFPKQSLHLLLEQFTELKYDNMKWFTCFLKRLREVQHLR